MLALKELITLIMIEGMLLLASMVGKLALTAGYKMAVISEFWGLPSGVTSGLGLKRVLRR